MSALASVLTRIKTPYLLYLDTTPLLTDDRLEDMEPFAGGFAALRQPQKLAAWLDEDENIGMLLPLPDSHLSLLSRDALWQGQYAGISAALMAQGVAVPLSKTKAPVRMDGGFFARTEELRPLAEMDAGLIRTAQAYLPALLCQQSGQLCAFAVDAQTAAQRTIAMQVQLDALTGVLATEKKRRIDQIAFRGQAIVDFYNERRHSMTLEQAFAARLSAKEKLWIVLRLLLSAGAFDRLYRLTHGGRSMPPPDYPPDPLD